LRISRWKRAIFNLKILSDVAILTGAFFFRYSIPTWGLLTEKTVVTFTVIRTDGTEEPTTVVTKNLIKAI
jgi:hypothetical protein